MKIKITKIISALEKKKMGLLRLQEYEKAAKIHNSLVYLDEYVKLLDKKSYSMYTVTVTSYGVDKK